MRVALALLLAVALAVTAAAPAAKTLAWAKHSWPSSRESQRATTVLPKAKTVVVSKSLTPAHQSCKAQTMTFGGAMINLPETQDGRPVSISCPGSASGKISISCDTKYGQWTGLHGSCEKIPPPAPQPAIAAPPPPPAGPPPSLPESSPTTSKPVSLAATGATAQHPVLVPAGKSDFEKQRATPPQGKKLLIGVETAPGHFEARKAILESWAACIDSASPKRIGYLEKTIDVRFFIGQLGPADKQLEEAINKEPNVVRLDGFVEAYGNLSAKTLGIISWANDNNYQHVLKVDDDVFLQLDELYTWMSMVGDSNLNNAYGGEFSHEAPVQSNPKSKWYMSDQYPKPTFPDYAFGPCYFIGRSIVKYIADNRNTLRLYRVEDAGLAIWLQSSGLQVRYEFQDNMYFQAECWNPSAIFTTPVNAKEMGIMQNNKMQNNNICGDYVNPLVLQECLRARCHCYPLPDDANCEAEMAEAEYQDVIPRLIQMGPALAK